MDQQSALLAATALHAGFQLVVTIVVYPTLLSVPALEWSRAHAAHSRRITYVVGPVYALVSAACIWTVLSGSHSAGSLVTVGGNLVAGLTTALVAAPTHGRLGREGLSNELATRLIRADRVRLAATLVALGAAASL